MFLIIGVTIAGILGILAFVLKFFLEKKVVYSDLKNKHVVITGGSSGIGKATALEAAKLGANVTVIGRDVEKLKNAVSEITQKSSAEKEQRIQYAALDVTSGYNSIKKCLSTLEADVGPIFMLINCAGMCICGQFENMKEEDIKTMIDLNYFGSAYPTKYVLPGMKERNEGLIVLVSTEAALLGIYGYSAYSAAKWAVRGLAEALNMELVGTNVRLTLAFPPDTDTPGFKNEDLTKPKETKLISGSGGLQNPEDVGKQMLHDALNGKTYSVFGLSGHLMSLLYCGSIESVSQTIALLCVLGCSHAAGILAPSVYGSPYGYGAYGNPYSSYPAQPALATQHQNIIRTPFNLGQISSYSKTVDTPFSSVSKSDVRVSNPGVALAPAYHGLAPAYHGIAPAYQSVAPAYHGIASPLVSHVGVAAPVAKVATGLLGVAYSAAPAVSHMTYTNGLGLAYSW